MSEHTVDSHAEHPYADPELKHYMRIIARGNRPHMVIFRALLTGIFTAVGATLGFALLLIIVAALVANLKQVPILDNVLQQTKLDVLIEDQLARIQNGSTQGSTSVVTETYTDPTYGFSFNYPSTMATPRQITADVTGKTMQFTGSDALQVVSIYVNRAISVDGNSVPDAVAVEGLQTNLTVDVFDNGAKIDGVQNVNAIFQVKFTQGKDNYVFIGQADASRPKLAREVFLGIVQSLSFKK